MKPLSPAGTGVNRPVPSPSATVRCPHPPRCIGFDVVEIARHQQIEIAVAVEVVRDDPPDGEICARFGKGATVKPDPVFCRYTLANVSA